MSEIEVPVSRNIVKPSLCIIAQSDLGNVDK